MSPGLKRCVVCLAAAWAILPATSRAQDAKELKPLATAKDNERRASIGPFLLKRDGVIIRSAEDLVALTNKAKSANDPAVQKEMEAALSKILKVDAIDWKTQTVLGVIGEDFDSLKTDGKILTATYIPFIEPLARAIPKTPKVLVLIEPLRG